MARKSQNAGSFNVVSGEVDELFNSPLPRLGVE